MDDQKDDGSRENKEQPSNAIVPSDATPLSTTILVPQRKNPKRRKVIIITVASVVLVLTVLSKMIEIPNALTSLILNLRQLFKKDAPVKPTQVGWQPPELPPGCSNVTMSFGDADLTMARFVAEISSEQSGTKFQIKDVPPEFTQGIETLPNYSPRKRDFWIRLQAIMMSAAGREFPMPVIPYVLSNRFYVYADTPFGNGKRRIVMNDDLDKQLPRLWDFNYDSNRFEVVTETTNPVFQVIYERPDRIRVNGLFMIDSNTAYASFANSATLITSQIRITTNSIADTNAIRIDLNTTSIGEVVTNLWYNLQLPSRKPIFKYPSSRYLGVLS